MTEIKLDAYDKSILIIPDKLLREKSKDVARVGDEERAIFDDMHATMLSANGIGLAAPQVGILKKLVVIDFSQDDDINGLVDDRALFLANPEIIAASAEKNTYKEGCLSIPEFFYDIERPKKVSVRYWDYWGKEQEISADGLLATCLQHEIDHLHGKLIIDYLSPLKRSIIIRKFSRKKNPIQNRKKKNTCLFL